MEPLALVLASASPRRRDILRSLGFAFAVRPSHVEEVLPEGLRPRKAAPYLAELKAAACREWLAPRTVVLTADTTVLLGDEVINKPADLEEARRMLSRLSGATQTVVTGVSLLWNGEAETRQRTFSVETDVTLATATGEEIAQYVDVWRPLDKAGGYGVQDWIGWAKCTAIRGSYSNVMGLPGAEVYAALRSLGVGVEMPGPSGS